MLRVILPQHPMNPPAQPPRWLSASLLALALVQTVVLGCSTPALAVRRESLPQSTGPAAPVNDAFERGMTQLGAHQIAQALQTFRAGAATETSEPFLRAMVGYCEMLLKEDDTAARDAQQALDLGAQGAARAGVDRRSARGYADAAGEDDASSSTPRFCSRRLACPWSCRSRARFFSSDR